LDYDNSARAFQRAIELDPQNQDAYIGCYNSYLKDDKAEEAKRLCEQGITYCQEHLEEGTQSLLETLTAAKERL